MFNNFIIGINHVYVELKKDFYKFFNIDIKNYFNIKRFILFIFFPFFFLFLFVVNIFKYLYKYLFLFLDIFFIYTLGDFILIVESYNKFKLMSDSYIYNPIFKTIPKYYKKLKRRLTKEYFIHVCILILEYFDEKAVKLLEYLIKNIPLKWYISRRFYFRKKSRLKRKIRRLIRYKKLLLHYSSFIFTAKGWYKIYNAIKYSLKYAFIFSVFDLKYLVINFTYDILQKPFLYYFYLKYMFISNFYDLKIEIKYLILDIYLLIIDFLYVFVYLYCIIFWFSIYNYMVFFMLYNYIILYVI